ncbi:hypothetical protein CRG98_023583 [Punica granatum]|uniref:Uncharacterized protein n=1 Tax=Punica granatum TaxID=22663 RepID=A0A2I0JID6_PUNGR|nr:hypothetical protein CRG98_023583 [Punica granatum]
MSPDEETAPQEAPGGLLMQGGSRWSFDAREKGEKRRWCTVERLLARDHLVTRKSEGREEPLGSDGTTRHGRGKKWHAEDPGACFRVPFVRSWIGCHGSLVGKASVNVRGCPGLSGMPLKCARTCHWLLWHREGFLESPHWAPFDASVIR